MSTHFKRTRWIVMFFAIACTGHIAMSQDVTAHLTSGMFGENERITLSSMDGWVFKAGHDTIWARADLDTKDWTKLSQLRISMNDADSAGRIEGWFRLRFRIDSTFADTPIFFRYGTLGTAANCYLDGTLLHAFGNTSTAFVGANTIRDRALVRLDNAPHRDYLLAIHYVMHLPPAPIRYLVHNQQLAPVIAVTTSGYTSYLETHYSATTHYRIIWVTVCGVLTLLFSFLLLLNPKEKILRLVAVCSGLFTASAIFSLVGSYNHASSVSAFAIALAGFNISNYFMIVTVTCIIAKIFTGRISKVLKVSMSILVLLLLYNIFNFTPAIEGVAAIVVSGFSIYYLLSSWNKLHGSQWAIVGGLLLTIVWMVWYTILLISALPDNYMVVTGVYLSFPLSLLVYVSFRYREIIAEVRSNADRVVQMTEEKRKQSEEQQTLLESEVKRQTAELRNTLDHLKATQTQLIQSEKMASLGELTAGIAHEIQNPLNFVNNFSEVNIELIEEIKGQRLTANGQKPEDENALLNDIAQNLEKIIHHGKRADGIVKGMLQHSRSSTGQKEPTDINALADEYLRLAYHGLRAKDKSFNATMKTDFDATIGSINIVPQDIGRVLLNLINNAFYACNERANVERLAAKDQKLTANSQKPDASRQPPAAGPPSQSSGGPSGQYEPTVTVTTKSLGDKIEIRVKDNGNGIPQSVLDKIFQPFFTTKPTGQGTGLGLSLSYDIVKAQGGEIRVETKEGEGAVFIITLPS